MALFQLVHLRNYRQPHCWVFFEREDIYKILSLYSQQVAKGNWRDYAIDHGPGQAIFSVFRYSYERPLWRITKDILASSHHRPVYRLFIGRQLVCKWHSIDELLMELEGRMDLSR